MASPTVQAVRSPNSRPIHPDLLPPSLSPVFPRVADLDHHPYGSEEDEHHPQNHHDIHHHNPFEHDYSTTLIKSCSPSSLHELGLGPRPGKSWDTVVRLPQSVLVPGAARGFYRSMSSPTSKIITNINLEGVDDMSPSVPSSPPDLSFSKDSKSSSSNSDDDDLSDSGLTERSSHFVDVILEEEDPRRDSGEDCNLPPASRPTLKRPQPRSFSTTEVHKMGMRRSAVTSPLQPMPNGTPAHHGYPHLPGAVNLALRDQSLNLPTGRTMQRAASNPTSPSFITRHHSLRIPSRSPSPNSKAWLQHGFSTSPQSMTLPSPKGLPETPKENGGPFLRRSSYYQPGRKTVQELEAECDDADEDVPDDAILENVPISPMPGHNPSLKTFRSPSTTTLRSTTPSPHRRPSYANLHSANIPKQAKRPSGSRPTRGQSRSPHGRPPMMPHSATVSSFPLDPVIRQLRSKSWTEDLNDEARKLSQALEEYAEKLSTEQKPPMTITTSVDSIRPDVSKARVKTSVTELPSLPTIPPVQRSNIMIDPLPISKEKEAVLTRTRPSWLPPKSQKEEKKHLKEFQQMMARAAEAEKKRAQKEQEKREIEVEMEGSLARIWDQHVLPNWNTVVRQPRTRELWWRGVTGRNRGEVWQKAIGNELELSAASFHAALNRANALEETLAELPDEERSNSKEAAWLDAIARDVPNVYPELEMYQRGGRLHQSLSNVLKAYAVYRSDIGYVYGTHLVAGIVCLLLPAPEAFVLLANMLNRPLPLAFLVHDRAAMARAYDLTLTTLKYKFTKLHDHLTSPAIGLHAEEYLDPIYRCLFAYNLPHGHVSRIWDVAVFEGDKALIRAAVAVLGKLESRLYGNREEILSAIGWRNEKRWDVGSENDLMQAVREAGKVDANRQPPRVE